jgi:NAD(P)H-hydrate epimerase
MPLLDRAATREVDRRAIEEYGLPGIVLMENAGRGIAETIVRLDLPQPFLICCGKGNNAGDGFVIARHLDLLKLSVWVAVWSVPSELKGDAAINHAVVERSGVPIEVLTDDTGQQRLDQRLRSTGTIVDALLGTGASGNPRPPLDQVIDQLNRSGLPIVAVDLPSGLDCDTGKASPQTICARHTCTFVAMKPGLVAHGADRYTGQIHVVSIGAPRKLIEESLEKAKRESHGT